MPLENSETSGVYRKGKSGYMTRWLHAKIANRFMSMNRWDAFSGWPQIYIPVIEELIVVELKVT